VAAPCVSSCASLLCQDESLQTRVWELLETGLVPMDPFMQHIDSALRHTKVAFPAKLGLLKAAAAMGSIATLRLASIHVLQSLQSPHTFSSDWEAVMSLFASLLTSGPTKVAQELPLLEAIQKALLLAWLLPPIQGAGPTAAPRLAAIIKPLVDALLAAEAETLTACSISKASLREAVAPLISVNHLSLPAGGSPQMAANNAEVVEALGLLEGGLLLPSSDPGAYQWLSPWEYHLSPPLASKMEEALGGRLEELHTFIDSQPQEETEGGGRMTAGSLLHERRVAVALTCLGVLQGGAARARAAFLHRGVDGVRSRTQREVTCRPGGRREGGRSPYHAVPFTRALTLLLLLSLYHH